MKTQPFNTPVLFLIFNRPDTTDKVFQRIRDIRPRQLFVSADGPRQHKKGEDLLCAETRKIIEKVDWPCEVKTNFSEVNLGCRKGVSSGIDWFFRHVTEGIILEDDCLPDLSFFCFCETLLEFYRNDERIMHIGGTNFQDGKIRGDGSYYFSTINHIWGWATWKRAWDKYDINISSYPEILRQKRMSKLFPDSRMREYWEGKFELAYSNKIDTWDIQWQYAMAVNNGLAIIPNTNLISNIGFSDNATHTIDQFNNLANIATYPLKTIVHPTKIIADLSADTYFYPSKMRKLYYLIKRAIKRRINLINNNYDEKNI